MHIVMHIASKVDPLRIRYDMQVSILQREQNCMRQTHGTFAKSNGTAVNNHHTYDSGRLSVLVYDGHVQPLL
jgi:hypothetical protein